MIGFNGGLIGATRSSVTFPSKPGVWTPGEQVIAARSAAWTYWTPGNTTTALWLDAADESTFTKDGEAISQWNDKSGNARHVTQATPANQPLYKTNTVNSLASVLFDGSNDVLTVSMTTGLSSSFAIFAVAVPVQVQAIRGFVVSEATSYSNYWALLGAGTNGTTTFALFDGTFNPNVSHTAPTANNAYVMAGIRNVSSDTVQYYQDGTLTQSTTDTTTSIPSYGNLRIGGQTNVANRYANVRICEVVILSSAPDATLRQQLEGYLAWKWGTTARLPSDHPYKNASP